MKKRLWVILGVVLMAASTAFADAGVTATSTMSASSGGNFVSGNKNNDGQYTPRKVVQRRTANSEPGFWDREWKRSGMGESGLAKLSPLGDMKTFLKEKEDKYRAKHPIADAQ
jgi:hypothetical protein